MKRILLVLAFITNILSGMEMTQYHQLPKAELHLHLSGAFPKDFLFSIATPQQQEDLKRALNQIAQKVDYSAGFRVFQLIAQIVNTEERLQRGVEALCASLQEDHVHYVEIRTGLKDLGQGYEAYLKAVLAGIEKAANDQFRAVVVLSVRRNSSLADAQQTIDLALKYQDRGVVGLDVSGDSTVGQIDRILPELVRAKDAGLPFAVHMGESPLETDQMLLLSTLHPKRIGHGVYLQAEAKEWILNHRLPVEVCLTSSVLVKMIDDVIQHPGLEFLQLGHPVIFCSDDPLLFSTTLSQELLCAHEHCGLSQEVITRLVEESWQYTLEPKQKVVASNQKPRVGVGVLVLRDGKVLLGKRKGAHGSGCYSPAGGNLEFKETVETCALRELAEETGLKALSYHLGPWTQNIIDENKHYISLFVIVTECDGEPQLLEPEKCEGWNWYAWDELPSPLFPPLESLIQSVGIDRLMEMTAQASKL